MEFKKAVKTKSRLRLAIDGVSGSGKTYSALAVASGMGGKIALIDSEHGSASLYADRFDFDTLDLMEFQVEDYIEALKTAAAAGYSIVIIDSTSHAWDTLVERVNRIALQKFSGNSYYAWQEGTPLQKKLIEAMLNYPGHVIVTCRSKTEYSVDKDDKGKTTIKKVGTAAVQRQGFEYEFTMAMTMDANHVGMVSKDRTGKFQDKFIEKPGKEFGKQLIEWLNEGAAPPPVTKTTDQMRAEYLEHKTQLKNIMDTRTTDGRPVFSPEEYQVVSSTLADLKGKSAQEYLDVINRLIDEKKDILRERIAIADTQAPIPAPAKPAETIPPEPSPTETTSTVPSMYTEQEPDESLAAPPNEADDGFEDDIPEYTTRPPKSKSGGSSAAPEPETAGVSEELDIF